MKKTLILTAAFACAAFTANAAVLVDSWGTDAFTAALNGDFSTTGNVATDNGGSGILYIATKAGLYGKEIPDPENEEETIFTGGYFYSGFSPMAPTNNLQFLINDVLDGAKQITLEIIGAGAAISTDPLLNFGSNLNLEARALDPVQGETVDTEMGKQTLVTYTYIWDVSTFGGAADFTIDFPLTVHNAIFEINLTQSTVPEPSTYALFAGAFGLAAVVVARRRRRA